jgi:2-hydroxy-6-oxonona-2,4-dienedioate hydrolase
VRAHFLTIDEARVRVLTAGEGPPLLLLHPIGHTADLFFRNLDVLGEKFSVIAPDLPGHGFSDAIDYCGSPPQVATREHLLKLMTAMGHDRFAMAGSSYGGLIATLLALEAPDRVERLCVIGSSSTFTEGNAQAQALRAVLANATTALRAPTLDACRRRMANICFSAESVAEEILLVQATCYALPDRLGVFTDTIEALIATADVGAGSAHGRLCDLHMPTLVIVGRDDIRADWRAHEAGAAQMPKSRLAVFDKCGHLPYLEHPARFNDTLMTFLTNDH